MCWPDLGFEELAVPDAVRPHKLHEPKTGVADGMLLNLNAVMACMVMAYMVMAYIVMAYRVMPSLWTAYS